MQDFYKALGFAKQIAPELSGRSFVLVMGKYAGNEDCDDDYVSDYIIAPRDDLPCWGELRKYEYSHGDDCTEKYDGRPTDLFQPFPEGKPEAVVIGLRNFHKEIGPILDEILSEGPWMDELRKGTEIERTDTSLVFCAKNLQKGLGFEPTVLVSMLAFLCSLGHATSLWDEFRKYLSVRETILLMMSQTYSPCHGLTWENDYYFANRSAYRILEGKPNLFSVGTFGDRVDYSRQRLQDVFGTAPHLAVYVYELSFTKEEKENTELFCKKFREHLQEHYDREKKELFSDEKEIAA